MKFDKEKIFTVLNANEVRIGSSGYFADNLRSLRTAAEEEYSRAYGEIEEIMDDSYGCRFRKKDGDTYTLFYLAEEPREKKLRPYKNIEVYTPTLEDLVEAYTYLDGSPCGIEEDEE